MELIVVSFSLVPECAAAADEREEFLDLVLVEVPGSEELVEAPGSVIAEVPATAADSFRFFAWLLVADAGIVLFLALLSHYLAASSAFLARSSAFFFAASSFSFFFCSLSAFRFSFSSISFFFFCSRSSKMAAHFALVSTLAPDTRLAVEALLLGVAFDITCTRYFDRYLSSESDSPELVPADEGTDPGVVTGVLVHELRVGDLLGGVLMDSLVDA